MEFWVLGYMGPRLWTKTGLFSSYNEALTWELERRKWNDMPHVDHFMIVDGEEGDRLWEIEINH